MSLNKPTSQTYFYIEKRSFDCHINLLKCEFMNHTLENCDTAINFNEWKKVHTYIFEFNICAKQISDFPVDVQRVK